MWKIRLGWTLAVFGAVVLVAAIVCCYVAFFSTYVWFPKDKTGGRQIGFIMLTLIIITASLFGGLELLRQGYQDKRRALKS